jgi:FkbM family methyltransferase
MAMTAHVQDMHKQIWEITSDQVAGQESGWSESVAKFRLMRTFGLGQTLKFFTAIAIMRTFKKFQQMRCPNGQLIEISATGEPDDEQLALFEIFAWDEYKLPEDAKALPISTVLDFGANVGMASLYFKMAFPDVKILAYEALFHHYRRAVANTKDLKNVEVMCNAVCTSTKLLHFVAAGPGSRTASGDTRKQVLAPVEGIDVFQDLSARGAQGPFLLKLDIEGGEYDLFDDTRMPGLLAETNIAFVELHRVSPECDAKAAAIIEMLKKEFRVVTILRTISGWATVLLVYR